MGRFSATVAVVTGAANGIGATTAALLARQGAAVALLDIDAEETAAVVKAIEAEGGQAIGVPLDVSVEADWADAIATVQSRFGAVTLLHSNAAITSTTALGAGLSVPDIPLALWDRVLAVNTGGGLLACKHVIPSMLEAGKGSIVFTSSVLGLVGKPDMLSYTASKGAIGAMTRGIAATYGKDGIRCNAVAPGPVQTRATATIDPELTRALLRNSMLPRFAEPIDIANAVAFLLSDESAFITGQILVVDGGLTALYPSASTD